MPVANVSWFFASPARSNLHDYQCDEVDTRGLICDLRDIVRIVLLVVHTELQPHCRERNSSALHPPEAHGEGEKALQKTDNEVGMEDESSVDQPVLLRVTRRAKHHIGLWLLVGKRDGGGTVGKTANDDLEKVS